VISPDHSVFGRIPLVILFCGFYCPVNSIKLDSAAQSQVTTESWLKTLEEKGMEGNGMERVES
jgi:hypothetical protein